MAEEASGGSIDEDDCRGGVTIFKTWIAGRNPVDKKFIRKTAEEESLRIYRSDGRGGIWLKYG